MRMRFEAHSSANPERRMEEILEGSHSLLEARYIEFRKVAELAGFDLVSMTTFTIPQEIKEISRHLDALRCESQYPN